MTRPKQGRFDRRKYTTQEALARRVFNFYKMNCKKRGRKFDLLWEEFYPLILMGCHYCGAAPGNKMRDTRKYGQAILRYTGLDRMDNARGYCPRNVVPCCHECNQIKGERLSYTEMLEVARVLKELRLRRSPLPRDPQGLQAQRLTTLLLRKVRGQES